MKIFTCMDCGIEARTEGNNALRCKPCAKRRNKETSRIRSLKNRGQNSTVINMKRKVEGEWRCGRGDKAEQIRCCIECGLTRDRERKPIIVRTMAEAEALRDV